jgi:NADPH2 dehydrogenase
MSSAKISQPIKVGRVELAHRIALAPLTRFRADDNHVPLPMVKTYYEQRASTPGTLLITEATFISPEASGYANVPGLFADDQLAAWREVTEAVHARGSFIYVQLWALGRAAKPDNLAAKGLRVKSASAIPMDSNSHVPEAMTEEDIQHTIKAYAEAAKAAVEVAGFDGVELHGANGYLIGKHNIKVLWHE